MIATMTDPMISPGGYSKPCVRCLVVKPADQFTRDRRARDGLYSACKECNRKAAGKSREENPEPHRAAVRKWKKKPENKEATARWIREWHERNPGSHKRSQRRYDLQDRYGITPEEYEERRAEVTRCAICKTTDPGRKGFVYDHCHSTGKYRGFLCTLCNTGLGAFRDNPDLLTEAIMYLMKDRDMLGQILTDQNGHKGGDRDIG